MPNKVKWLLNYHFIRGNFADCQKVISYALHNNYETDSTSLTQVDIKLKYIHSGLNSNQCFFQGQIHRAEGRIQEALRVFQSCYENSPGNPDSLKEMATCL